MNRTPTIFLTIILCATSVFFWISFTRAANDIRISMSEKGTFLKSNSRFKMPVSAVATSTSKLAENFTGNWTLYEAGSIYESMSKNWWVNSGAKLISSNGIGKTIQGNLGIFDKWMKYYALMNPIDTDNGAHPQNIFRLVGKQKWGNFTQELYFRIEKTNLSASPNRNASNGVFLFNRYATGDNLYYTGLRVDGSAVIKKKIAGVYYTVGLKQIFNGNYDRQNSPNLLPENSWIGIKSEVATNPDGSVSIRLFSDIGKTGNWQLVLDTVDAGRTFGGPAILAPGYNGIRTDFMDVEFESYKIESSG